MPSLDTTMQPADASDTPARNHHSHITELGKGAAILCGIGAGLGTAVGLSDPQAGLLHGQLVPAAAGFVLAGGLSSAWHVVLTAGARVRSAGARTAAVAAGLALGGIAIGTSSWAVATFLSGDQALRYHRAEAAKAEDRGLEDAWANVQLEVPLIEDVAAAGNSMRAVTALEQDGALSKQKGDGTRVKVAQTAAKSFDELGDSVRQEIDRARQLHDRGRGLLERLRLDIDGDPASFAAGSTQLQGVIADLKTVDPTALVAGVGISKTEISWTDSAIQQIKAGYDKVTTKLQQRAKFLHDARHEVATPLYIAMPAREATWAYASHVMGAWISAVAIDMIPLIFLLVIMATPREQLMLVARPKKVQSLHPIDNALMHGFRRPPEDRERAGDKDDHVVSPWRRNMPAPGSA